MKPMKVGSKPSATDAPESSGAFRRAHDVGRILGFDGIRALAFLGVFANHKLAIPQRDALGAAGVWTFFALSGFLITGILARSREEVEAGHISAGSALKRFYLRRTARIFPIYYAFLTGLVVVSMFTFIDNFWIHDRIAYFLYGTNILIEVRGAWLGELGHLWSLAVEEQYYLLFAPLVLFFSRRHTRLLCLSMVGAAAVTSLAMHAAGVKPIAIYVNSMVNFGMLGYGGLVGLAAHRRAPAWLTCSLAQGLVVAALIAAPIAFGADETDWLKYGPAMVLLAGLLLFQIYNGQGTLFVAVLDSAPLRLVGRVSYAAYLVHPLINFSALQARGVGLHTPRPEQIAAEFAATMLICAVSWRVLEAPIIRWASRVSNRLFAPPARHEVMPPDAAPVAGQ